jgi:hypothetical protein
MVLLLIIPVRVVHLLDMLADVHFVLIGFEPGVKYDVRVRALNGKGIGDWSEPVSLIAR